VPFFVDLVVDKKGEDDVDKEEDESGEAMEWVSED
jgi:hypothetical protein